MVHEKVSKNSQFLITSKKQIPISKIHSKKSNLARDCYCKLSLTVVWQKKEFLELSENLLSITCPFWTRINLPVESEIFPKPGQNILSYPQHHVLVFSVSSRMPYHCLTARASEKSVCKVIVTVSAKTSTLVVYSALVSLWMILADVLALVHT